MRHVVVRYRVKPDQVETNEALVRAVYEELARTEPEGIHYATFKLADGVSFMHVAAVEEGRPNPLAAVHAFEEFQAGIEERCDEPPVVTEARVVGSFRFFGTAS